MARRHTSSSTTGYVAVAIFIGLVCGFLVGTWSRNLIVMCTWGPGGQICCGPRAKPDYPTGEGAEPHSLEAVDAGLGNAWPQQPKNLVFIGVMTARKYVSTRIVAAYQTWASSIPGKVVFFSSHGSEVEAPPEVPVVGLRGVDDTYPPQKKSFLMLKYMHDHYLDQYEWFMRVDDDAYIKGDKLGAFLHSINSSKTHFIGQAGLGTKDEFGKLSLEKDQNFCMGGPGIVFSRSTLQKIVPNIRTCLHTLRTTHEDVEIGRCVAQFAGVPCTWAFEMQQIFYQNHLEPQGSFTHSLKLKQVHQAITLHPIKNHTYQYRVHSYLHSRSAFHQRQKLVTLQRQIAEMNELLKEEPSNINPYGLPPSLMKFAPSARNEVISWEFISKYIYSHVHGNPKRGLEPNIKTSLNDIMMQVMQIINKNARQRGRTIDFKEILYGYRRTNPMFGADYILDLLLVYRKHKGRRLTVPVRRHAYIQQTFLEIEFREESLQGNPISAKTSTIDKNISPTSQNGFFAMVRNGISHFSNFYNADVNVANQVNSDSLSMTQSTQPKVVNFILPLAGRFDILVRFMENFEDVCLKREPRIVLVIVLFKANVDDRTLETVNYISKFKAKYPQHSLRVLHAEGQFSRGKALSRGASIFPADSLLFFIDVDILFNHDALQRVRYNTVQGQQVYYPIVFSQFDPDTYCPNHSCPGVSNPYFFTQDGGYWRQFGFGIACMYKSDFQSVGGFDTKIQGWGKEDVDLFERYLNSSLSLFRAVDPGMVHIFHAIHCDPSLESAQYQMCLGTKAASFGSTARLADMVFHTPAVLKRNMGDGDRDTDNQVAPEDNMDEPGR